MFGKTFIKENRMLFSRAERFDQELGVRQSVPFFYDEDNRKGLGDRLFIKDANAKDCYIVYDKVSGKGNKW